MPGSWPTALTWYVTPSSVKNVRVVAAPSVAASSAPLPIAHSAASARRTPVPAGHGTTVGPGSPPVVSIVVGSAVRAWILNAVGSHDIGGTELVGADGRGQVARAR